MDGVSSFEMVVDNENGGIQMNNIMVLHTGSIIKLLLKILIEARGKKRNFQSPILMQCKIHYYLAIQTKYLQH